MNEMSKMEVEYFEAEFASQVMDEIPANKWIDKTIGGCGLSYLALTDKNDALILSPRVALIENKRLQKDKYPDLMPVYAGVTKEDVLDYMNNQKSNNRPAKLYATYNSVGLGKLDYLLDETDCRIYVDESQYLLEFAETEPELCIELHRKLEKHIDRVSFFSAHPPKIEYMPKYIREMGTVKYVWSDTFKATPFIVDTNKTYWAAAQILNTMIKNGSYNAGNNFNFKKAIVFVNSVSAIKKIISNLNTDRSNIAYIVGDTAENDSKLDKVAYRLEDVNNLPLITFGTSSMISGIDLYDKDAANIVISSTTKEWTMFDQELDVPQAITRQRVKDNPFRDKFLFILNKAEMQSRIDELENKFNDAVLKVGKAVVSLNYLKDGGKYYEDAYPQYKGYYLIENDSFIMNESLLLAKKYKFKELFYQYQSGYSIRGSFAPQIEVSLESIKVPEYSYYAKEIQMATTIKDKLAILEIVHNDRWKNYLEYGIINDKVLLNSKEAKEFYESRSDYKGITISVFKAFTVGKSYTINQVKDKLQSIYDKKGLNRKAKSTDLYEFMQIKEFRTNSGRFIEVLNKNKTIK